MLSAIAIFIITAAGVLTYLANEPPDVPESLDSLDGSMDDIFSLQSKVVSGIISVLKVKLPPGERLKLKYVYTDNIDAYDSFLRGWELMWRFNEQSNVNAREYLLKAIDLDPGFARAYANLAVNYVFDFKHRWSSTSKQSLQRATRMPILRLNLTLA